MGSANVTNLADYLITRLQSLEYAIRTSMLVREDLEDAPDPRHMDEAGHYGIHVDDFMTKGDLLSAVQTLARTTRAKMINEQHS